MRAHATEPPLRHNTLRSRVVTAVIGRTELGSKGHRLVYREDFPPLSSWGVGGVAAPANSPDLVGTVPIFSLCPDCPDHNLIIPILDLFDSGRLCFF